MFQLGFRQRQNNRLRMNSTQGQAYQNSLSWTKECILDLTPQKYRWQSWCHECLKINFGSTQEENLQIEPSPDFHQCPFCNSIYPDSHFPMLSYFWKEMCRRGLMFCQDVGVGPNAAFLPDFHLSRCSVLGVAPGVGELESLGVPY